MPYVTVLDASAREYDGAFVCQSCACERFARAVNERGAIEGVHPRDVTLAALDSVSSRMTRSMWADESDYVYLTTRECFDCDTPLAEIENDGYCPCNDGCYADDCESCREDDADEDEDEDGDGYQRSTGCPCENCAAGVEYAAALAQGVRA
jgi:hypothetical protein